MERYGFITYFCPSCEYSWTTQKPDVARPTCEECVRLEAEFTALFQTYLDARETLMLTLTSDGAYLERLTHLDDAKGQLREAWKRDEFHESTH